MHINIIPNTTMTSDALTHRAAVRTRKKYITKMLIDIPFKSAILMNCISDICRMCQKHTINDITGTICAVTSKRGFGQGWINKVKIEK